MTVVIVGVSNYAGSERILFSPANDGGTSAKTGDYIIAYLVVGPNIVVDKLSKPLARIDEMTFGSKPVDGGNLLLSRDDLDQLKLGVADRARFIRPIYGSEEFIGGKQRYCIWVTDSDAADPTFPK